MMEVNNKNYNNNNQENTKKALVLMDFFSSLIRKAYERYSSTIRDDIRQTKNNR